MDCKKPGLLKRHTHQLGNDVSLVVAVSCAYPQKVQDYMHLDVKLTLTEDHCDNTSVFKQKTKGISGLCAQYGSGSGNRECKEVVPTPKPTRKPTRKPRTSSPTLPRTSSPSTTTSPTSTPTDPSRTTSPTLPPTANHTRPPITPPPSIPPTMPRTIAPTIASDNITCTIYGDPHARCFALDSPEFNFFSQKENPYVMLYEIPDVVEAVGRLNSYISEEGVYITYVEELLVKYNNTWQSRARYDPNEEYNCIPHAPKVNDTKGLLGSTSEVKFHLEYKDLPDNQQLIITWECPMAGNLPAGMHINFNKLDAGVPAQDQYTYESEHNGGICAQCDANHPYTKDDLPEDEPDQANPKHNNAKDVDIIKPAIIPSNDVNDPPSSSSKVTSGLLTLAAA